MALDQSVVSAAKDKAESLFEKGRYAEALSTYEKIRSYGSKDPRIHLRMGDIARKDGNNPSAIAYYKDAADAFIKLGFIIKAIAVCKMIVSIDPSQEDVHKRLAELHARQQPRKEEAIRTVKDEAPAKVPKTPLFSDFNEAEFLEAVKKVRSRELAAGAYLFREGDRGDSIFIVAEGEVEVVGSAKDGSMVRFAALKEGSIFGEFGFFLNSRRTTGVRAAAASTILELTKDDIGGLIARHKRVESILFDFYKERVVDRLMALTEIFRPMSAHDRIEVLKRLSLVKFEKGSAIVKEGDKGDTMYLIKDGKVSVWIRDKKDGHQQVTSLQEGDFFGEIALATARARVASVTALTDVELVEFSREMIKDILGRYPEVKTALEKVIKERVVDVLRAREETSILI